MHQSHTATRHGLVRPARQVAFLEAERREHATGQGDVLGLPSVRRAGERHLLGAPPAGVESTRFDEREHLEGLGARTPHGEERRVARASEDVTLGVADYCVDVMPGLDRASARSHDIELISIR